MTKTDYRQFIDEVYFLGKQKEFSGIFNKILPSFNIFASAKKTLLNKRKAYDFALANLFRKYGVNNDKLYDELDKIWDSIEEYGLTRKYAFVAVAPSTVNLAEMQLILKTYIDRTKEYCESIAKEEIDE